MAGECGADCGVPNSCRRDVPGWLVALDNVPTIALFALGTVVVWLLSVPGAIAYLAYCAVTIPAFWALICPYCHHHGTRACPCGYGMLSSRVFTSRRRLAEDKNKKAFASVFRARISIMFPCWLIPLVAGIWLLLSHFTPLGAVLLAAFCVDGFLLIPAISFFVGCSRCEIKTDCPWMMLKGKK